MPTGLLVPYFLLRVQLVGIDPPIWRSFLLPDTSSFHWLHRAILAAGGWSERHRFKFQEAEGTQIIAGSHSIPDASTITLAGYFASVGQACVYEYDPIDGWQFDVRLIEMRGQSKNDRFLRRLVGGARAYPPEDCGGVRGYGRWVAVRAHQPVDPRPREIEMKPASFGDWQPEAFDFHRARGAFHV